MFIFCWRQLFLLLPTELSSVGRVSFVPVVLQHWRKRYTTIHRDLAAKMDRIDKEQTMGFFDVVPEIKSQGSS
jgi:hypothetical protein